MTQFFSRRKFKVGTCSLISTKIPLLNDTSKYIEPERKLKPEEFHQVEELINELLQHDIIAPRFCSNISTDKIRPKQHKTYGDTRIKVGRPLEWS